MGQAKPQKIGRYEIESLVGEGATAVVFKAHDPLIDRTVAIKLLKREYSTDAEFSARFQREAKSAGAIAHPNIVTIYDVGLASGTPYIAMEFLEDESLAGLLANGAMLPLKKTLSIGIQLAQALDYAHRGGVVHRDIKPANILLNRDGQTVKITDFGVAQLARGDEIQRTQVGTVLGTPRYMSPEQLGGQEIDGRSDLFSLGAILYELLTGRRAFEEDNLALLLVQILQKNPAPPSRLNPEIPEGLDRAIMKLLNKKPEQRFRTGEQLSEALERELQAQVDAERLSTQDKFLPLRVKLALRASAALALVFVASMGAVYLVERNVLRHQVVDSGAALANFVAVEAAVPVLGQNWLPLTLFVEDAKARGSFDYLVVVDHHGTVQAATDGAIVGRVYTPPRSEEVLSHAGAMTVFSAHLPDGRAAFLFDTPILFQKTPIGKIYLGIDEAAMNRVLGETLSLLTVLAFASVAAVGSLSYLFGAMLANPMRLLRDALLAVADGDVDRRISQKRRDELGETFAAFNRMADMVQQRVATTVPAEPAQEQIAAALIEAETRDTSETLLLPA